VAERALPEPGAVAPAERVDELRAVLGALRARLDRACVAAGRASGEVTLIGVTKTWPATDAQALVTLGLRELGESRDQEASVKAELVVGARWHFVGALQTNKARSVATYADVVHSVDRSALVRALSAGAVRAGREVLVLLQVSLDGEAGRAGAAPGDLPSLADQVVAADGLRLGGLMAVAPRQADPAAAFAVLAEHAARLRADHPTATTVSAGMSADLEAAVDRGATHVRVGSALLGRRPPPGG